MYVIDLKEVLTRSGVDIEPYYQEQKSLDFTETAEAVQGDVDKAKCFMQSYYALYRDDMTLREEEFYDFFELFCNELQYNEMLRMPFSAKIYEDKLEKLRAIYTQYNEYLLCKYASDISKQQYFGMLLDLDTRGCARSAFIDAFVKKYEIHQYKMDCEDAWQWSSAVQR